MTQKKPITRKDPERRFHDAAAPWSKLKGKRPDRHYVYVHKASVDFGPDYYESLGYEVENKREGGPVPAIGGKKLSNGSTIELRGHVLMSISKERHAEVEKYGPDGESGQDLADRRENEISGRANNNSMKDGFRARSGRLYFQEINETTPELPE